MVRWPGQQRGPSIRLSPIRERPTASISRRWADRDSSRRRDKQGLNLEHSFQGWWDDCREAWWTARERARPTRCVSGAPDISLRSAPLSPRASLRFFAAASPNLRRMPRGFYLASANRGVVTLRCVSASPFYLLMSPNSPATPAANTIEHLLSLMATRMSWSLGAKIVDRANLHVSRGWRETIAAARSRPPADGALEHAKTVLSQAFGWHTFVGNKQVTWYDLNAIEAPASAALLYWATNVDVEQLNQTYGVVGFDPMQAPYVEEQLRPLVGAPARLVSVARADGRLYFQYFSARSYSARESIDVSDWPDEHRARLGDFYEIIGVKLRSIPCFDTIVVDVPARRLEVRVDFAPGLRADPQAIGVHALLESFNDLMMRELTLRPAGLGLVNFFPAVSGIYGDRTAGRVAMLGFVATSEDTSSNNKGQTLRRQDQDLRNDKFHVGGTGAVESVTPYTIGATWPSPSRLEPLTIELHGSVRMIYGIGTRAIAVAIFLGCTDGRDFDFLAGELARQLTR